MTSNCNLPFNSEFTESDDIKCCEEKLNSLPFIDEIRNFVSTEDVEFVNTQIHSLENLNVLLQSIVYVGLDNYDPILLEFFWNDARSISSQLLESVEKKPEEEMEPSFIYRPKMSFTWKPEIENYYFVKQTLYQSKKQYLTIAINQTDCSCHEAAGRGNLRLLKWLRSKNEPWDEWTCRLAALNGHLEVLKWAREYGCPWDKLTCAYAASSGHLEILKWAHENKCPWNESTCQCAAKNGHLEVLKWAREQRCPWDKWTCIYAAENGHMDVLKWAREYGCPWDEWTCAYASYGGHLEVLKWARKHGCPWNEYICVYAAENGHSEILKWVRENGCPE